MPTNSSSDSGPYPRKHGDYSINEPVISSTLSFCESGCSEDSDLKNEKKTIELKEEKSRVRNKNILFFFLLVCLLLLFFCIVYSLYIKQFILAGVFAAFFLILIVVLITYFTTRKHGKNEHHILNLVFGLANNIIDAFRGY